MYYNEQLEIENIKTYPLQQSKKCERNNFAKDVKDLYTEIYKTVLREIKENLNKLIDMLCYGLEDSILLSRQFSSISFIYLMQSNL